MAVKLGNGNWAVKEDKLLAYNDNSGRFFNKEFDFSRGSSATYVGKDGLIKSAASDVPRIDFSDSTNGALLLEPQRTNLFQHSEQFSNNYWLKARIETPYIADVLSPDGTLNAYTLEISSGETGGGGVYKPLSVSGDNSWSVFAKKGTVNYLVLGDTGLDGSRNAVYFNIFNGTIGSEYQNATGEIEDFGNGWYRCTMKYTLTSTGNKFIYMTNIDGTTSNSVVGGDYIYIYGAQLEQGYATSYIPSLSGSATTRLADVCNNSGSAQDFNSEEGVLYAEIAALANDGTNRRITLSDGTNENRVVIGYNTTSNRIFYFIIVGGSAAAVGHYTSSDITQFSKVAVLFKLNDYALWVDGVERHTDTSGTIFSADTLSSLQFRSPLQTANFYGNVKNIQVFTEAKSDEFLAALTTI